MNNCIQKKIITERLYFAKRTVHMNCSGAKSDFIKMK